MDFKNMEAAMLEERKAQIANELEAPEADLNALEEEVRAINDELKARAEAEAKKAELRAAVAAGEVGEVIVDMKEITEERKTMDAKEVRNSAAYIDAYAEYLKSGNDEECRALLTENATNGTVPVPELVYDIVKTAWEKNGITRRVKKAYVQGNLKVGFEISSTAAVAHPEGNEESEETLVLGTVELVPATIMKWVSVSKEAKKMRGEAFIRYIYDELTYRIAKKAADNMIAAIKACGTVSTATCPSVPAIVATGVSMALVASAISQLSDEAVNPIVMMNKATWAAFKAAQYAGNYSVDPFEGLEVEFNSTIKSLTAASTGDTWLIVGDLENGALMTLPDGEDIEITEDSLTLATSGLIRYIGDMMVAEKVIAPDAFVKVTM